MKAGALAVLVVLLLSAAQGCGDATSQVTIVDAQGLVRLIVDVETAETAMERSEGLSEHQALGPNEGLLLVFPTAGEVCITNRTVAFPIDVLFISADQQVIHIERELPSGDPGSYCHAPTWLVLELQAGAASEVAIGDTFRLVN